MKFRSVLLILGAVLIMTAPVVADEILQSGHQGQSFSITHLRRLDSNKAFHVADSKSSMNLHSFFLGLSATSFHAASPVDLGAGEHGSAISDTWRTGSGVNLYHERQGHPDRYDAGLTQTPEPGSLSLLVLGLAGLGLAGLGLFGDGSVARTKTNSAG